MGHIDKESKFEIGCSLVLVWLIIIMGLSLLIARKCEGQGAGYVILQTIDKGIGLRVDYYPLKNRGPGSERAGIYHSLAYGSGGLYRLYGLGHHYKFTTGALIPLPDYPPFRYVLTLGASYHYLQGGKGGDLRADPKIYRPWSCEAGVSVYMRRLAFAVNTDILRWEPSIGIGIMF
jgi:hypothetical protein